MRLTRWMMLAALAAATATGAAGDIALVPLPRKVKESAVIARVRILSTTPDVRGGFRSVAHAEALETVKGSARDGRLEIAFDNGAACPNVHYKKGDHCLVFLKQEPDGRFSTYNFDFGKFEVVGKGAPHWPGGPTSLADVYKQIRAHLRGTV